MVLPDLSERFDVSVSLIPKTFTTWINFLYHELPLYFPFPSQKLVRRCLPKSFEKYQQHLLLLIELKLLLKKLLQWKHKHKHGLIINTMTLGKCGILTPWHLECVDISLSGIVFCFISLQRSSFRQRNYTMFRLALKTRTGRWHND